MLGKLIKHEWNALGRLMLPLYGLLLLTAPAAGWFLQLSDSDIFSISTGEPATNQLIHSMMGGLIVTFNAAFVLEIIAIFVGNIILVAIRFYKTMTEEEAYLTHTLPVTMHQLLISKTVVSSLYVFISTIVSCIASMLYALCSGNGEQIPKALETVMQFCGYLDNTFILTFIELLLLIIATTIAGNLQIFASIALGHLAKKHRIAFSFLMYIVIHYAKQFITMILVYMYIFISANAISGKIENLSETQVVNYMLNHYFGIAILLTILAGVILYVISHQVFQKKLNLD